MNKKADLTGLTDDSGDLSGFKNLTGLKPRLRFPEFLESGEWEEKALGDMCTVLNNRRRPVSSEDREKGTYPYYGASGIVDFVNDYIFDERLLLIGEDGAKWGSFEQTAFIAEGKYWVNNHAHVLKTNGVSDTLIENYLNMINLSPFVTGHAPPKLTLGKLKEIPVPIPTPPEQQKIAECLTSLDEMIAAERARLEALKAYKKGLLQNLFPAEGESTPKLRFPEFQSAGEWEEKSLGEVCEKIMDGTHFSPKSKSGSRMYLTSKNIQNGIIDLSNVSYITEEEHREIYAKCPVKKNDVLLTKDGANTGNCALNNLDVEFSLLSSVAVLRGDPKILNQGFLYQVILSDKTQKLIQESMSGQAITRITLQKIEKFSIFVTSTEEQEKIAECLTALDEEIAAQSQRAAGLAVHKQGLLQGLFP